MIHNVYKLCGVLLLASCILQAMDFPGAGGHSTTLSINSDATEPKPNTVMLVVNNKKTVQLLKEWKQSGKSFEDWRREKYSKNEEAGLLKDESARIFVEQIGILKAQGVAVREIFRDDVSLSTMPDTNNFSEINSDNQLIVTISATQNDKVVDILKSLPVVEKTIDGNQENINKIVNSYQNKVVGIKALYLRLCCCTSATAFALLLGAGAGIFGTWLYMQNQEDQLQNQLTSCQNALYPTDEVKCLLNAICPRITWQSCLAYYRCS